MDTKTYEQFTIAIEGEEEKRNFLKDGENYQVVFWESTPIDIKLPTKMVFTVSEAEKAERGDTVSGATKVITCARGNFARMVRLETADASTTQRLAAIEERLLALETRQHPTQ